jgi:hypothetical protein
LTLAKKCAVLLFSARQLFRSLKRNSRVSFCRKLRFQSPKTLPKNSESGTCVSVNTQKVLTVRRFGLSRFLFGFYVSTVRNFFGPFLKMCRKVRVDFDSFLAFVRFSISFFAYVMALRSCSQTRLLRFSPISLNWFRLLNLPSVKQSSKVSWRIRNLFPSKTCLVKNGISSILLSSLDLTKDGFKNIWLFYSFHLF